jgi:hypothetical protein
MNGLERKLHIKLTRTAKEWELYEKPGVENAAQVINRAIEATVNGGSKREDTRLIVGKVLESPELAQFGACDSEVYRALERVLDAIYDGTFDPPFLNIEEGLTTRADYFVDQMKKLK